jgi:hypothetical protein
MVSNSDSAAARMTASEIGASMFSRPARSPAMAET